MGKFFPTSARHAKAREFLELKQGKMTMLEYVAKFKELARFADDYVVTNMAKVRKFEDGLKFSIRGKIVGLLLQELDSMVMVIEIEVDDTQNIRDTDVKTKMRGANLLLALERSKGFLLHKGFKDRAMAIKAKAYHPKVGDISRRLAN